MITKKDLMHALNVGGAVAGKNKVVPIFEYVKCEVDGNLLTVYSNDGECGARCTVPCTLHDETFAFCVNASDFMRTIKSIKDDSVNLRVENGFLLIEHAKGVAQLPVNSDNTFPVFEDDGTAIMATMPSAKLAEWLKLSNNFIAKDDLRPILQGMMLRAESGVFEACATDAHKLFTDKSDVDVVVNTPFDVVIPARCCAAISNVLATDDTVIIRNYDKNVEFIGDNCAVSCRKLEGNFPNYRAVIPNIEQANKFVVGCEDFQESVVRAGMYSDMETSQLKLEAQATKLHIVAENLDLDKMANEYVDFIEANTAKSTCRVSLKADYLLSCINSLSTGPVDVYIGSPDRAVVFKDRVRANKIILQMPLMS